MKLEKFDYQIGNKKQKRQFVMLGALCIALIITVVLYKTFASFSDSATYNIINSRVGAIGNNRTEIIRVNISKEGEENEVYAILYDDETLSIDGTGYMKDFENSTDLIGEVLDAFINEKAGFTEEELAIINGDDKANIHSALDWYTRSLVSGGDLDNKISENLFNNDADKTTEVKGYANKITDAGFVINKIEIVGGVKNVGKNAFSITDATSNSEIRTSNYTAIYITGDYLGTIAAGQRFNSFDLEVDLEDIGDHAFRDLNTKNIIIGDSVTTILDDMFAWYSSNDIYTLSLTPSNESNEATVLSIPNGISKIGINAFYRYDGANLTLPEGLTEIDQYAFANYYGNEFTIPSSVTILQADAFRDFAGRINMSSCPQNKDFAKNAHIYANDVECVFE